MAATKLTPAQQDKVLDEIATRYLRRERQVDIGLALDLSQQQISYYLRKLRAEWRTRAGAQIDEAQAEELAKIDALEAEYWREYARSQKPLRRFTRTQETKDTPQGKLEIDRTVRSRSARLGATEYLKGVAWCIEARCRILGLTGPLGTEDPTAYEPPTPIDAEAVAAAEAVLLRAYAEKRAGLVPQLPADGGAPDAGGDPA